MPRRLVKEAGRDRRKDDLKVTVFNKPVGRLAGRTAGSAVEIVKSQVIGASQRGWVKSMISSNSRGALPQGRARLKS